MSNNELIARINSLKTQVDELTKKIDNNTLRVEWDVKKTDSGLILAGGPTTIKKSGIIISSMVVPTDIPGQLTVAVIIKTDEKTLEVVPLEMVKFA